MKTKIINIKHDELWIEGATNEDCKTDLVKVVPGLRVILYCNRYVGPSDCHNRNGDEHWHMMDYSSNPNGVPGNMDPSCRALEGWRGTTNDWSCHAHGVWDVVTVGDSIRWEERPEPRYGFGGVRMKRVELRKIDG